MHFDTTDEQEMIIAKAIADKPNPFGKADSRWPQIKSNPI